MKNDPWMYKTNDLNGETIIGRFYEKKLLLNKLQMSCYTELDSQIRDKAKVVLNLSSYTTIKT